MNIQYLAPLSRGFERMKKALFNPLEPKKWFVVGFTAFLSGLTDCRGGGGSGGRGGGRVDWEDVLYFPQTAWYWLVDHPVWAIVIVIGSVLLLAFGVLIVWWSSRGKFMFLDNVVHDRSRILAPWTEFRHEGNSLFLWGLALGVILLAGVIWYLVSCIAALQGLYESGEAISSLLFPAITMAAGLFGIFMISGFIDLLLYDFVVPIMYRDRINTFQAIQKFARVFVPHFFHFLGYALFVLVVVLVMIAGVVMAGFATCCVGFVLLAIPYLNAVILLPFSYTLRAFSVEFLEQFGSDYQVFLRAGSTEAGTEPAVTQG